MQTDQKSPLSCLDANEEQAARYERFMCTLAACLAEVIAEKEQDFYFLTTSKNYDK